MSDKQDKDLGKGLDKLGTDSDMDFWGWDKDLDKALQKRLDKDWDPCRMDNYHKRCYKYSYKAQKESHGHLDSRNR